MSVAVTQLESARDIVVREYLSRRPVQLDTSGAWHRCSRISCDIERLQVHVCLDGDHAIRGRRCEEHPYATIIQVKDVYVCKRIGVVHVCDRVTCTIDKGQCTISGQACAAQRHMSVDAPISNRRTRRRSHGVHTNEQSACILLYDLLFSRRRLEYETHRIQAILDVARRSTQRIMRLAMRENVQLRYQAIVDVYAIHRAKMRSVGHLTAVMRDDVKQDICRYYARTIVRAWGTLSSKMPYRCTFEATAAAIMYGMRRGVACDGIMAVPKDMFLSVALPDAHSIAEVHITRRSFTQAKNSLFGALQACVHEDSFPVEKFATLFDAEIASRPAVLGSQFY